MSTSSNILREIPTFGSRELEDLHQIIGSGGMGVVSHYKWKVDVPCLSIRKGQEAAVKKLDCTSDIRGVKDEAKILWPIHRHCAYILHMHGLTDTDTARVGIVLDYMKYGNISDFFSVVKEQIGTAMDFSSIWPLKSRIAQQICDGMVYLHGCARPVLHCDLKAANVLLDEELIVKICDFGLAKIKRLTTRTKSDKVSKESSVNCPAGTVSHVAPELLHVGAWPTKKSDVYSFGVLIWELLADKKPYEGVSHPYVIIKEVLAKKRPNLTLLPTDSPELLKRIMMDAWHQDPGDRPDFSELRRRLIKIDTLGIEKSMKLTRRIWEDNSQTTPKELRSRDGTQSCSRSKYSQDESLTIPKELRSRDGTQFCSRSKYSQDDSQTTPKELRSRYGTRLNFSQEDSRTRPKELQPTGRSRTENRSFFPTEDYSRPTIVGQQLQCPVGDNDFCEPNISNDSNHAVAEAEHTKHFTEDSREPLLEPPSFSTRSRDTPKTFRCQKVAIAILLVAFCLCGTFLLGRYVLPSYAKGCCRNCFDPVDPGMQTTCNQSSEATTAPPGSTCTFACEDGYILNDNVTKLTCGYNGVWSGPLPYCRKIRQCPPLKPPANGGSMQCTSQCYEGSKCAFKCPSGYRLRLPNEFPDDFDITCQSDEVLNYQWSGEEPYCEKVVSCALPTNDPNVVLNCTDPSDSRQDLASAKDRTYFNGTVCAFSCPSETSLGSNETASVCLDDGNWNTTAAVSCINACPYFNDPLHSEYNCTKKRLYDSKCTFSCSANFVMVGSSIMVCQSEYHKGQWQSGPPQCECPTCRSGENCENVVAFEKTWDQLNSSAMMTTYDGREIICINKSKVILKKNPDNLAYGCQCRDSETNINKQCNDDTSLPDACKKAYASLILIMSYGGKCSLPCDAEDMPRAC